MFDGLYTRLTAKIDYKVLAALTPAFAAIMLVVILTNGLEYGIDFKGGMWIDILTDRQLETTQLRQIESDLSLKGLKDVKASVGYDINTEQNKLTIQTTTVVEDKTEVLATLAEYAGELIEYDTAKTDLSKKPQAELKDNLEKRLKYEIDISYKEPSLTIVGMDLVKEDLDSALTYYLGEPVSVQLSKKNLNMRSVGPTLGATFREQGFKALLASFALMSIVVFLAFHELIPSVAVIQAAVCDITIALGGMSLLGIPLEPATIGALLMLIGYSVDTDIMLTSRTLKDRSGEFNDQVEDAIKTGLTMSATTLIALGAGYIISTTLTQIPTWANISSVLIIGLLGDLPATWLTNTGIIKWYILSGKGKKSYRGNK